MPSARDGGTARRVGAKHALRARRELGIEAEPWVDPFSAIEEVGALLFFAPLKGLCGAFMPKLPHGDAPGIMVSITFPMSVQRFTAAHELGHLWMQHRPSIDTEDNIQPRSGTQGSNTSVEEIEAESFAAHFLMPNKRVTERLTALGREGLNLTTPARVYDLSLWFGVSYTAMAWHLVGLKLISRNDALRLVSTQPKQIKMGVLGKDAEVDWHQDVWALSATRSGEVVHARVGDALTIALPSHASSGYVWNRNDAKPEALELLKVEPIPDGVAPASPEGMRFGSSYPQRAVLRVREEGQHPLALTESRPWSPADRAGEFHLTVIADSLPVKGLSRRQRLALIQA
jgi:predicted secreted protein